MEFRRALPAELPACAALYQRVARATFTWRDPDQLTAADFLAAAGEGEEVFAAIEPFPLRMDHPEWKRRALTQSDDPVYPDWLDSSQSGQGLEAGAVVGVLSLWPPNFVHSLYVDEGFQGQGAGPGLLAAARERAAAPLLLKCQSLNHAARRFYARHGFVEAGGGADDGLDWVFLQQQSVPGDPDSVALASPLHPESVALIAALDALMNSLYPPQYPPQFNHLTEPQALAGPDVQFLVARIDGRAVGCVALRSEDGWGEVKRLYVEPALRGQAIGRRLMQALTAQARALGLTALRLETGGGQPGALALYRSQGFVPRGPFGAYADNGVSLFFEKRL